ncbi:unnamed protein product [Calypogeia fissa]
MFDGGRKLSVGDCALFQAANAHPYIGILRKVTQEKDTTKFSVNWLYRPADVKLAKGGPLEAAPNEIFYSFHKDEISAASLLHPCKVAFLRKGTDLPQGVSSFVCRRVYDTANKCLWWLTDRDYTDEHQDEVDQLLERTKLEMQAAVQSGGPSPSPRAALSGGPTSSQQLKTGSDAVQNATYSASNKSKKRERADQNLEPSKRERSAKSEDGELSPSKRERSMKPEEIASITDKDGGLLNQEGVKVLVQLMQQDRNDGVRKSTDVSARRTMLAAVVAATERDDCLSRFVVLGGLPMLDDWLQEAHKGKVGDGGSPKEGDKGVEELLLTLLKALDKLPVDLDALKTCSVGKSVNHLRSHKNVEIQKKARKLVDIWKKRVDAEMKLSGDVKPGGSNSNLWNNSYKQNSPDMHSHLMKSGGPTEVAVKSSGASAGSAKPMPNGMNPGECLSNGAPAAAGGKISTLLASSSPSVVKREESGSTKLPNGTLPADLPAVKEERNTTPLQPQNNGQAWGNGAPSKSSSGSTWKEDVKNASMGGPISSKSLGTGSRHPSMNGKGLLGASLSGSSKDMLSGKPLVWSRSSATEKMSSSTPPPSEKASAETARDSSNSQHRLIVRIPNPGRSPARSGGASEQSAPGSRVVSPNVPERSPSVSVDASDGKGRVQIGNATSPDPSADNKTSRLGPGVDDEREKNVSSVQSDVQVEGEKRGEESTRTESGRNIKESNEHTVNGGFTPRNGTSESAVGSEDGKTTEIGSGTKGSSSDAAGSEATAMDVDDLGISLLASVAASEIRRTGASEATQERSQPEVPKTEQEPASRVSPDTTVSHLKETAPTQQASKEGDGNEQMETKVSQDAVVTSRDESNAIPVVDGNAGQPSDAETKKEGQQDRPYTSGEGGPKDGEKRHFTAQDGGLMSETSGSAAAAKSPLDRKGEDSHVGEAETESAQSPAGLANPFTKDLKSSTNGIAEGHDAHNNLSKNESLDERKILGQGNGVELCNGYGSPASELINTLTGGPAEGAPERMDRSSAVRSSGTGEGETDLSRCVGGTGDRNDRKVAISVAEAVEAAYDGAQELKRRAMDIRTLGSFPSFQSSQMLGLSNVASSANLSAVLVKPAPRALPAGEPTTPEQATETAGPSDGVVGGSDVSERPDFDLNEGFSVEESPQDDSTTSPVAPPAPVIAATSAPGLSSLLTAPIAIVTATKGGFVLPASPMRTKSELGWKGSAATSAFRPAEPRRTPERQASAGESLAPEASTGSTAKKGRPPLDLNIDLNVSDDRNFEDVGIAGGAGAASSLSSQGSAIGMGAQVPPPSLSVSGMTFQSDYASSGQPQQQPAGNSSAGRPILDLNMLDESEESGTLLDADTRVSQQVMAPSAKSNNSSSLQAARRVSVVRDFDLNDGPLADEAVADDQPVVQPLTSRNTGASMTPTGPALGRGPEVVHSSWFAHNNSFKPAMPDYSSRTDYPYSVAAAAAAQSYLSAGAGSAPFNNDMYRNVALSSAPPTAYPSGGTQGPYHYGGGFAVATGFPFSTGGSFTPSNVPPYLDSSGSVNFPVPTSGPGSSHLQRPPYIMGLSSVGPSENGNTSWSARPSLDLNAGPEPADGDGGREELMSSRSAPILGGPPSLDQMRVFRQVVNAAGPPVSAPPMKRKEPENGWDMNRSSGFKQQAWR